MENSTIQSTTRCVESMGDGDGRVSINLILFVLNVIVVVCLSALFAFGVKAW